MYNTFEFTNSMINNVEVTAENVHSLVGAIDPKNFTLTNLSANLNTEGGLIQGIKNGDKVIVNGVVVPSPNQ